MEIPEVPDGTLERTTGIYSIGRGEIRYSTHAGRCFELVHTHMLDEGMGRPAEPVPPSRFAEILSRRGDSHPDFLVQGTPLLARWNSQTKAQIQGEELPAGILSNAMGDLTVPVRAALLDYVRDNLVTDGTRVYASRGLPVVTPHAWRERYALDRPPTTLEDGPIFEPARFGFVKAYQEAINYRGAALARVKGSLSRLEEMEAAFGKLPYTGLDVALYVNAGPATVERLFGLVSVNCRRRDVDMTDVGRLVDRLRPFADLGTVGAIPASSYPDVVALLGDALDTMKRTIPEEYSPILPRWLKGYSDTVMRPHLATAPVPPEDVDSLSTLAFGA